MLVSPSSLLFLQSTLTISRFIVNMGQRFLQLNSTYTVSDNGTITLHCSQMPPNANLFTPGPAFIHVVVNGVPSNGTYVIVGSGDFGTQPISAIASLPASVNTTVKASGNGGGSSGGNSGGSPSDDSSTLSTGVKIGIAVGGVVVALLLVGLLVLCFRRRKNRDAAERQAAAGGAPNMAYRTGNPGQNPDAFIPLQQYNNSAWDIPSAANASRTDLHAPMLYSDDPRASQDTRFTGGAAAQEHKVQYDDEQYYDTPPPSQHPRFNDGRGGQAM